MDEIKIGEALEKQTEKEEQSRVSEALQAAQPDKKEGKNILILLAVLIGVIIFSIGGFKVYENLTGAQVLDIDKLHQENREGDLDPEEGYIYNGYSFIYADGLWWTEIQDKNRLVKVPLHFGPREVEEVQIKGSLSEEFNQGVEVYISIDPEFGNKYLTLALSEVNFNIGEGIRRKPVAVCSRENKTVCEGREILNCEDTQGKPVITFQYGGQPKITLKDTCITISGEEYGIVKAADRLVWQWYGIMS